MVSAGFGFPKLIEKIGVERRVHTAGEAKVMLDPFQPEKPEDVARLEGAPARGPRRLHRPGQVARGRALADDPDLFTGAFWSGERAVALGLADRVGDLRAVLRERYGEEVQLKPIGDRDGLAAAAGSALGAASR